MKRKPKETKKERKQRLVQGIKAARNAQPAAPLHLADSAYVEAMLDGSTRLNVAAEVAADPRVSIWLQQLDKRMDLIASRGSVTRKQCDVILSIVQEWENANATNRFKSKAEASVSVARMLDSVIKALPKSKVPLTPEQIRREAEDIGELSDAILDTKSNFVKTAGRVVLPEGQAAVETYLYCMQKLMEGANGIVKDLDDKGKRAGIEAARQIWAQARDARVFEIPAQIWQSQHRIHEQHFMMAIAKQQIPQEEALEFLRVNAQVQPFPEKLPFDYCYIGLGAGVMLDLALAKMRISGSDKKENVVGVCLLGYLICGPNKQVYEMLHVILEDTDFFLPLAQRYDGSWPFGETLAAWLVAQMVDLINEHNTVVINHEPSQKMKAAYRKTGKGAPGFLPRPYYTLHLKHSIIDESELEPRSENGFGRTLAYRYDRRGHERCYVARGPLPIDEKTEKKLLKYGYRFIVGKPDAEDAARLAYRNFPPKRSDEWMAVKVRWIEDVVVGDEKLPYIPAVRVPEKPQVLAP